MVSDRRVLLTITVERVYGADLGWKGAGAGPARSASFVPER
ncbi:hypothetical protein STENM36S_06531 [Streptomyces tendae]